MNEFLEGLLDMELGEFINALEIFQKANDIPDSEPVRDVLEKFASMCQLTGHTADYD